MRENVLSKPGRSPAWTVACPGCGNALWPDITVQGRSPMWVCPSCRTPRARFWHRHHDRYCPLGYPWPLRQDPTGQLFICC